MTNRNINTYAINNWHDLSKEVSVLSSNEQGIPLVESNVRMYCYDDIIKTLFERNDCLPNSADALCCNAKWIWLIEFKSGFHRNITKDNYDDEKAKCTKIVPHEICHDYWTVFWKLQEKETAELKNSIQMKAMESYIALEKKIMPLCDEMVSGEKLRLGFLVVVDENPDSAQEEILSELAKKAEEEKEPISIISSLKQSLHRFNLQCDSLGQNYFYDRIEVMSSIDFLKRLNLLDPEYH